MKKSLLIFAPIMLFGVTISFAANRNVSGARADSVSFSYADEWELTTKNNNRGGDANPSVQINVNAVDRMNTNNDHLTGIKLTSSSSYQKNVINANGTSGNANTETGQPRYYEGYDMPYCQAVSLKYKPVINMDNDLHFYMSPVVAGYANASSDVRFVMALCDGNGEVINRFNNGEESGFKSSNKYVSWELSRSYYNDNSTYRAWDSATNWWYPIVYEKINSADKTTVGRMLPNGANGWLEEAFYGLNEYRKDRSGSGWTDATFTRLIGTLQLVDVTVSFDKTNETLTLAFDHTYLEDLDFGCRHSSHPTGCHYEKTYNLSDLGFTTSSNLQLYFGYYSLSSCWTASQLGESDIARNRIPMSLQVYNLTNTPDSTRAENYAEAFNDAKVCGSNDETAASQTIWNSQQDAFDNLTVGAKEILNSADGLVNGTAIEDCLARYDQVITKRGVTNFPDFMKRIDSGKVVLPANSNGLLFNKNKHDVTLIIATLASISLFALVIVALNKKRAQSK